MTERRAHLDALAIGLMVLFCAMWGMAQVAAKVSNAGISPLLQGGLRSAGATLLLLVWCWARGVPLFRRDGSLKAGLLAGLLFGGEFGFIYWGLQFTTASRGVLFLYTAPFIVVAGLHWLEPLERLAFRQVAGLLIAFVGVVAAFLEGLGRVGEGHWLGDAMLLVAAVMWGATTIVVRSSALNRVSASKALFYQLAVSAVVLLAGSWIGGEPGFTHPSTIALVSFAWQTIFVAFASYLGWFWLITAYPASRLAAFSFLTPLFGMLFGAVLLDEPVTPLLGAALVFVAAGLWLVNRRHNPPQPI